MTIVVDANVAIAVLNPSHPFHRPATRRCLVADGLVVLNLTRVEALIHPCRLQQLDKANAVLDKLGFRTKLVTEEITDQALALRSVYGSRSFPLLDVVVVAAGVVHGYTVVTCAQKWPDISEAVIEVLVPD